MDQAEGMVSSEPDAGTGEPTPTTSGADDHTSSPLGRRRFLALGAGGLVVAAAGAGAVRLATGERPGDSARAGGRAGPATPTATPSDASAMKILTPAGEVGAGDLFFSDMAEKDPRLVIAASSGAELWSKAGAKSYADFRVQTYHGRSVFTWWESDTTGLAAYGDGRAVIADVDGAIITEIGTHAGVSPDEHEFLITPSHTALVTSYVKKRADLSPYGGSRSGWVMDGVFEEIDLATGKVLMHWSALDHVDLAESYAGVPDDADEPYDYFHINSIKPTPDGHFLVSARHTWGIYKIDAGTGRILWRLGGRRSDFDLPGPAAFAWQHDAQFEDDTTLRLFDNGSDGTVTATSESRLLWLTLDQAAHTATLTGRLAHPDRLSAAAMGNAQLLDNGNLVVGWGTANRISEFTSDGTLVFDAALTNMTYRCFRNVWR